MPSRDIRGNVMSRLASHEGDKVLRPRYAAYVIIVLWFVAVVAWGVVEHLLDDKTFPTVWLGMWWALQTVTTVGYGDVVPQDTVGKGIASLLMLGGLAFLSVVTATITSSFVARRERETAAGDDPLDARFERLHERLDGIEADLHRLVGRAGAAGRIPTDPACAGILTVGACLP